VRLYRISQFDRMRTVRIMEFNAVKSSCNSIVSIECIGSSLHGLRSLLREGLFTDGFLFADSQAGVKMVTYGCIISILSTLQ
jgi:hypothetical protein